MGEEVVKGWTAFKAVMGGRSSNKKLAGSDSGLHLPSTSMQPPRDIFPHGIQLLAAPKFSYHDRQAPAFRKSVTAPVVHVQ